MKASVLADENDRENFVKFDEESLKESGFPVRIKGVSSLFSSALFGWQNLLSENRGIVDERKNAAHRAVSGVEADFSAPNTTIHAKEV